MDEKNENPHLSQYYVNESSVDDFQIDYFGYKPIAKELTSNIIRLDSKSGYVLAINGNWGSGKSSFLFYIKQYLTVHRGDLNLPLDKQEIIVFNFDPWLFSGHQDIVSQFFMQLKAQTNICKSKISKKTLKVLNDLFTYGSHLRKIPTLEGQITGWSFAGLNKIIESKIENSVKSIFEIKRDIFKELQGKEIQNLKIVIIIDDIDRLTSAEIRELFRAIKAIADFPNIIYLLSYDDEIVIDALKHEFNNSTENNSREGLKYLEKIVQFAIPLPMIGESLLKDYTEKIVFDEKFKDTDSNLIESTRWTDVYHNGLRHFLRTPRNVIRLHNALLMLYPSVKNEVNVVDFICLIVLRHNYPELYTHIKNNPSLFIKDASIEAIWFYRDQSSEFLTKTHEEWINSNIDQKDRKEIAFILSTLFPEISPYLQHLFMKTDMYFIRSPKSLNISYNYDTFLKYFRYHSGSELDYFSDSQLFNIINSINNPDNFVEFASKLNSRSSKLGSKALTFFERIFPLINKETSETSLENLVMGIFKIKNEVLNIKNTMIFKSRFRKNIFDYIMAVLSKALTVYPKEKKLELLKKSFSQGTAFSLEAGLIIVIREQNGDWGGTGLNTPINAFLDLTELKQIEEIYIKNVQNSFSTDLKNFSAPYLSTIICVWNKLNPKDPKLVETIEKMWESNNIIIEIIRSSRENNYLEPIAPHSLDPIKSEEEFRERVETILKTSEIKESEKSCLVEFLKQNNLMDHLTKIIKRI